ncbi:MAG: YbhB/YbcL family Raf kinase inhibitor-like protein [Pseudomonadota bacterium]
MSLSLSSTEFENNSEIPIKYTCDGEDISPPLEWSNIPKGTKSFVLIMDDPDTTNGMWDHWIVYNISTEITKLEENIKTLVEPTKLGLNSWRVKEYGGPCPPSGEHHYYFKLYALNNILPLPEGASRLHIENAMEQHILEQAVLIGRYTRTKNT